MYSGRKKGNRVADYSYDVVVIGSGPAGESAAIAAAKRSKREALIEREGNFGGNCAHRGTIPSKSLRHVVKQIIRFRNSSIFREISDSKHLTFPAVLRQAKLVIPKQVDLHTNFLIRNRVKVHV